MPEHYFTFALKGGIHNTWRGGMLGKRRAGGIRSTETMNGKQIFAFVLVFFLGPAPALARGDKNANNGDSWQPLMPRTPVGTVPALPVQAEAESCQIHLSEELFGGVKEACEGSQIDRGRCCPVVAAWLYAARARAALDSPVPSPLSSSLSSAMDLPVLPDDSQTCANALQSSLRSRGVNIPQPNASCDPILCFCGIRLHQIGSFNCPAAAEALARRNSSGTRALEAGCRRASYSGCTGCLKALKKLKGSGGNKSGTNRTGKVHGKDCELMGLTWLLAKNKTAYIPTVSAILRAIMYSSGASHLGRCSPDHENMPLAVDSAQLSPSAANIVRTFGPAIAVCYTALIILLLLLLLGP